MYTSLRIGLSSVTNCRFEVMGTLDENANAQPVGMTTELPVGIGDWLGID